MVRRILMESFVYQTFRIIGLPRGRSVPAGLPRPTHGYMDTLRILQNSQYAETDTSKLTVFGNGYLHIRGIRMYPKYSDTSTPHIALAQLLTTHHPLLAAVLTERVHHLINSTD